MHHAVLLEEDSFLYPSWHCNIGHLSVAREKLLMERWLRSKAMCGFGFVL